MGGGGSTYDYGFRIYNPQIAKFLSVDTLFKSYPWYTPYQFAGNMPIWAIDLDGLEELIVIRFFDTSGNHLGEVAFRVPVNQRVAGRKNGGDSQIIDQVVDEPDLSAQILASRGLDKDDPKRKSVGELQAAKTLAANVRNRRAKYLEEIKDDNGQFQGKYRDQMSVVDSRKNNSIMNTSASSGQISIHYSDPVGKILFYSFDNANSQIMSGKEIETFKKWLEADEDRQIVIQGYSSEEYDPNLTPEEGLEYNQNLSQDRADDAAQFLISNGIDASRITSANGEGVSTDSAVLEENRKTTLIFIYELQKSDNLSTPKN